MSNNNTIFAKVLRQRNKILIALLALLVAAFSAWRYVGTGQQQTITLAEEASGPMKVRTQTIQYQEARPQVQSFGSLSFEDAVNVSPRSDGTIEEIFVKEGDKVRKGQLLVRLSDLQLDLQYSKTKSAQTSAEIAYELAKIRYEEGKKQIEAKILRLQKTQLQLDMQQREIEVLEKKLLDQRALYEIDGLSAQALADMEFQLEAKKNAYQQALIEAQIEKIGYRQQDLLEAGYGPIPDDPERQKELYTKLNNRNLASELSIAEAKVSASQDELNSIKLLVEALNVRSPIDGVLAAKQLSLGQRVKIDSPLLTIINQGKLYVVFPLQESLIGEILIGGKVEIHLPALGKKTQGTIEIVNPLVDPNSGNFTVKARLDDQLQNQAKQGMFASVNLPLGEKKKRILIPKDILLDGERKDNRVFTLAGNYIATKNVSIGATYEAAEEGVQVEVLQGLNEGDVVVTSRSPNLFEGMEVVSDDK